MKTLRRALGIVCLMACVQLARPAPVRAEVVKGDALIITAVTLGTLGGLTTSIGAFVFSSYDRAFTDGWVVASLLSAAATGAMTVSIFVNGMDSGINAGTILGIMFYGGLTAWPGYWTVKTALADVDPGESFDAAVVPAPSDDPERSTQRREQLPTQFVWSFQF